MRWKRYNIEFFTDEEPTIRKFRITDALTTELKAALAENLGATVKVNGKSYTLVGVEYLVDGAARVTIGMGGKA